MYSKDKLIIVAWFSLNVLSGIKGIPIPKENPY
jgi:hypothetical protein